MPYIDVSSVILDPMVAAEPFTVLRNLEVVNEFGESVITRTSYSATGSISPTGDNSLLREEGYQTQKNTIRVITTFRLQGAAKDLLGNSYQPDIIVWGSGYFLVRVVNDYTSYGMGFIDAEAISVTYPDLPAPND